MTKPPKYLRPYQMAEQIHGPDFRATLWNSRQSQRLRFEVMAETYPLGGLRLLDAGCGLGDFLAFLEEVGAPPARYVGVDALESVIAEARKRTFATPAEFLLGDLVADPSLLATGQPEVVAISGTLNTLSEKQFYATIERAWASAERCLLFNFLSTHHASRFGDGGGIVQRVDPVKVFACGLRLTCRIVVRHDYYQGHDCTMAWIKP